MAELTTKVQVLELLQLSNQRVIDWFTAIPADYFFIRHEGAWSASDNLDHLIKAHQPLARALKLPKLTLRAMFGKPENASMSYDTLCQLYREAIAKGAQASGRYLPNQESPASSTEGKKKDLLEQFAKVSTELVSAVEKWREKELDDYVLPHPILGKLTVREMIYFTIYHNLRHASKEGD